MSCQGSWKDALRDGVWELGREMSACAQAAKAEGFGEGDRGLAGDQWWGGRGLRCLRRGWRTGARYEVAEVRSAATWAAERRGGWRRQPLYGQGGATAVGGDGEGGGEAAATAEAEPAWTVEADANMGR